VIVGGLNLVLLICQTSSTDCVVVVVVVVVVEVVVPVVPVFSVVVPVVKDGSRATVTFGGDVNITAAEGEAVEDGAGAAGAEQEVT